MAVTVDQLANQIKAEASSGPPPPPDDGGTSPPPGAGGGSSSSGGGIPSWMQTDWAKLGVDPNFVQLLVQAQQDVSLAQQLAGMGINPYILSDPNAVANAYFSLSDDQKEYMGFNVGVKADRAEVRNFGTAKAPDWRVSYDNWMTSQPYDPNTGKPGAGAGGAGIGAGQQAQIGYDYAALAQRAKEAEMQNALQQAQLRQSMLGNRASTGLSLGGLVSSLADRQQALANDPGNFPAYLAAQAGLPQGQGSPITQLLGSGIQIKPTTGANPLADPRFRDLISQEYSYAQPQALQTVFDIMDRNGGKLPQAFYDYTHTQNPDQQQSDQPQAYARGGTQMLNEPVVGIGLKTRKPRFLAGEKGKEKLTFTPMKGQAAVPGAGRSATGGGSMSPSLMDAMQAMMGAPHPLAGAFSSFGRGGGLLAGDMNWGAFPAYGGGGFATAGPGSVPNAAAWNFPQIPIISFADGGDVDAGGDGDLTPAQGTAKAAGKAMDPYGWKWGTNTPYYLPQQLNAGNAPTPGSLDEFTFQNMPWSLQQLIGASVRSRLGQSGLNDWNSMLARFRMPSLNAGYTTSIYQ